MQKLHRISTALATAIVLFTTTCVRPTSDQRALPGTEQDGDPAASQDDDDLALEPTGPSTSLEDNLPSEDIDAASVGALPARFHVTDDGVATYRVPLALPVGHAEVQPKLELSYSSAAGNGLLGVGFSIAGLSSLSRCKRSIVPDGQLVAVRLDDIDNLCLDGARLQLITGSSWRDGATYRPERDDFVRITQVGEGEDAYFVADHPSGKRITYGGTSSSRVFTRGVVSGWSASRVEDPFGNFISIVYASSTDDTVADGASPAASTVDHRPDHISMWGTAATNPREAITFHYDSRPDPIAGHVAGGIRRTSLRLDRIELRDLQGIHYRDYVFEYGFSWSTGRSRLRRVGLCSAIGNECVPATTFEWSISGSFSAEDEDTAFGFAGAEWPNMEGHSDYGGMPANTNGDAYDDLVFLDYASLTWRNWRGGLEGDQIDTGIESPGNLMLWSPTRFRGHVDNDGKEDVLVLDEYFSDEDPSTWDPPAYLTMLMGTDAGLEKIQSPFGPMEDLDTPILDAGFETRSEWTAADFNGDGLLDLAICHAIEDAPDTSMWSFYYADGSRGWIREDTSEHGNCSRDEFIVLDFDGDKAANLLLLRHPDGVVPAFTDAEYTALVKTPWGQWADEPTGLPAGALVRHWAGGSGESGGRYRGGRSADIVLDLNGDELPDIVRPEVPGGDDQEDIEQLVVTANSGGGCELFAYLNTGAGFRRSIKLWPQDEEQGFIQAWEVQDSFPFDVDMDGTQELVVPQIIDMVGQQWLGVGLRPDENNPEVLHEVEIDTGLPLFDLWYNPGMSIIGPFDWNGDGLSDFLLRNGAVEPWTRQGDRPDLLVRITDGYGALTEVEYAPLRWVHTTDTSACDYPVQCSNDSRPVVRYEDHDLAIDPQGFAYQRIEHAYVDGRTHRLGRGWLGFSEHSSSPSEGDNDPGVDVLIRTRMDNQTYNAAIQDFPFAHRPSHVIRESEVIDGRRHVLDERIDFELKRPDELLTWFVVPETQEIRAYELASGDTCTPDLPACAVDVSTLDGMVPYRSTRKSYAHDDHGNLELLTVEQGGRIDEIERSYLDSTDDPYFLGRVTERIERSTVNGTTQVRRSTFTYDLETGALAESTIEPGSPLLEVKTKLSRDPFGNVWSNVATDPNGKSRQMLVTSDLLGVFPRDYQNALGHIEQRAYSYRTGQLRRAIDANGVVTDNTYDRLGRRVRTERFAGIGGASEGIAETITYERVTPGEWTEATTLRTIESTAGHHYLLTEHDRRARWIRRVSKEVGQGDVEVLQTYDEKGLPAATTIPSPVGIVSPGATLYKYDALRRLRSKTAPDGAVTQVEYPSALERRVIDPVGRPTTFTENSLDQVVQTKDAAGTMTCYAYGAFGVLLEMRRGCASNSAHWTTATYDAYGRRVTARDPDRGSLGYSYNAFGELTAAVDGLGATSYEYDALGRATKRTDIDGITQWTWDRPDGQGYFGKLRKDRSPDGIGNHFAYDAFGRVTSQTRTDGTSTLTVGFEYDVFSRPTVVRLPTSFGVTLDVERVFDGWGHLVGVRDRNTLFGFWTLNDSHPAGMPQEEEFGNGLFTTRLYDPLSLRPSAIVTWDMGPGEDVQGLTYEFNLDGTLESREDAVETQEEHFTYDTLGRLDTATASRLGVSVIVDHNYDAFGNLTLRTGAPSYVYGDANRPDRLTKLNGKTVLYDAVGNITNRGGTWTATYTAFDVPRQVVAGGVTTTHAYDASGAMSRRTSSADGSTTRYLDDYEITRWGALQSTQEHRYAIRANGRLVAEVLRTNAAEAGAPGPGGYVEHTRYFHDDHLGSLETITDEVGAVVQRVSFDSFGKPRNPIWTSAWAPAAVKTPLVGFTGVRGPMDGGLVPMPRRWYDPSIGRFVGPDPLIGDPHTPLGQNRYAYVWNRPLSLTDPSGLAPPADSDGEGMAGLDPIQRTVVVPAQDRGGWFSDIWQQLEHGLQYSWERIENAGALQTGSVAAAGAMLGVAATELSDYATFGLTRLNNFYSGVGDAIIPGLEHVREAAVPGVTDYDSGLYKAGVVSGVAASLTVSIAQAALAVRTAYALARSQQAIQAAKATSQTAKVAVTPAPASPTPAAASGAKAAIGATGKVGEEALKALGGESQVYFKTSLGGRYVDQLIARIANEAKVGYTALTQRIATQIAKDAELVATGRIDGATWHFFQSPVTGLLGPSGPLRQALQDAGIGMVIH